METPAGAVYRFGPFEVDTTAGELLKQGKRIALQEQPFRLLVILLENSGEVVSRAQIENRIWEADTFVDFDSGLRVAVAKLRAALGDDANDPRYIETIPKRGYRFLGPATQSTVSTPPAEVEVAALSPAVVARPAPAMAKWGAAVVLLLAIMATGTFLYFRHSQQVHTAQWLTAKDTIVLGDFSNSTGDSVFDETLREGMAIELDQSPFLSLVTEPRIQQTLRLMGRPADGRLTPEIALEVCERTGSAAVISGSISALGNQYVLALRSKDCRSGNLFDEQQVQVARKEDVLHALTAMASQFRSRAGESLVTVQEHAKPLEEATTPSLDALKAFSTGLKVQYANGSASAIPFLKHAIDLDPNFATAYAYLGRFYGDIGELGLSAEYSSKAYELRDHASDAEKFFIIAHYQIAVTGNMEKARQTCEEWAVAYPREKGSFGFRGGLIYPTLAKFEDGVKVSNEVIQLDPDFPIGYVTLAENYLALDQFQQAENALLEASRRGAESPEFPVLRYDLAFLRGDHPAIEQQLALSRKDPNAEAWVSDRQAFALAFAGRLADAQKMSKRAIELDKQADQKERAAHFQIGEAVWDALYGERDAARRTAMAALSMSNGHDVEYGAAVALAFAGDNNRAISLTNDLERRFPEDTAVQLGYLPVLRARLDLNNGDASKAIEALQAATPYELGTLPSSYFGFGALYPIYLRGEAFLMERQGKEAAEEFHKILDHRGIVLSDPVGVLAHLQLGRAYVLAGDNAKARDAYRDFFTVWKDADPDIPILKEAQAEYKRMLVRGGKLDTKYNIAVPETLVNSQQRPGALRKSRISRLRFAPSKMIASHANLSRQRSLGPSQSLM